MNISVLSRRDVLIRGGTGIALAPFFSLLARPGHGAASDDFTKRFHELVAGGTPVSDGITLKLDDYVANGAMAFFRIDVESEMTEEDHVKRLHLLSTENPFAHVASYKFTLASGKASIAGRMRLANSQEVVALAELSGERLLVARRHVKVAIGGCGPM